MIHVLDVRDQHRCLAAVRSSARYPHYAGCHHLAGRAWGHAIVGRRTDVSCRALRRVCSGASQMIQEKVR
jgi:hypothetical protein